jgi:hypothetical protein
MTGCCASLSYFHEKVYVKPDFAGHIFYCFSFAVSIHGGRAALILIPFFRACFDQLQNRVLVDHIRYRHASIRTLFVPLLLRGPVHFNIQIVGRCYLSYGLLWPSMTSQSPDEAFEYVSKLSIPDCCYFGRGAFL